MKKISFHEAKQRFVDQGRTDVELCEDGFKNWTKKSKFYDKTVNDYFWAIPKSVYNQKSSHPKRHYEKVKETILKRHGVSHVSQIIDVKNKKKNKAIEKYGVDCVLKSNTVKEKIRQTNIKRRNVAYPMQDESVKEKLKNTNILKYGVENVFQSNLIKEKIVLCIQNKFGTDNISQSLFFKKQVSKRFIKETGEHLRDWLKNQPEPKPGYSTLAIFFKNREINMAELTAYINGYKTNKTCIETIIENMLNVKHYNRKILNTDLIYKPDFKLSESIYLNADGLYWHCEDQKNKNYHFNMRKDFESNNLRIFQFHENEIKNKPDIVKSIINNTLDQTPNKIFARKCTIKQVEQKEADIFLEQNHLMDSIVAKHVGLYSVNNILVSLLSYKEKKNIVKIERFCSLIDINVIGGFSKLLNHLECNLLKPSTVEVHNWIDLRYGTGNHLASKGFKQIKETLGWKWTDRRNIFDRRKCHTNMDSRKLSKKEYAKELKWHKIYDAGQRLYIKNIK